MADYSLKDLASNIEFDIEDYIPLLKLFVDTTNSDLSDIRTAAASSNGQMCSSNIHNIKGAAMNLDLVKIVDIVEEMSKLNKDGFFAEIEVKVKECETELGKLSGLLR